jgi:DNA-binding response OmpR family regulator
LQRQSSRILVVDDDREIRMLLVDVLEGEGYDVVSCSGGEEALEALRARPQPGQRRCLRSYGELTINMDAHQLWAREQEVQLTRMEFDVLAHLFRRLGCAVSNEELLEQVWGDDGSEGRGPAVVKSCVCRLRKKIGDDARQPRYIRNVRGFGYQLGGAELDQ